MDTIKIDDNVIDFIEPDNIVDNLYLEENRIDNLSPENFLTEETINLHDNEVDEVEEIEEIEEIEDIDIDLGLEENKLDNTNNKQEEVVENVEVTENKEIHEKATKDFSLLDKYGENITNKEYLTNPAIGRDNEISQLILTLLTPEKSAILVGKPGIGKTAIVEGLSYKIKNKDVPDALLGYTIFKLNSASLTGLIPGTSDLKIQAVVDNLKEQEKVMVFIDEIHTLIGTGEDTLDFANIFKPVIDRGSVKIIGATTTDEYERYVLRDKAFVRRFQRIDVSEPTGDMVVKIMMGTYPKFEKKMGLKLKYSDFIKEKIMTFIVECTTEFKRVYEISARYPDIALTILQQAFSQAAFDNRKEVNIRDIRKAIETTKLIYPDVIKKELVRFNTVFKDVYLMETKQILKDEI